MNNTVISIFKIIFSIIFACAISLTTFLIYINKNLIFANASNACEGESCIPVYIFLYLAFIVSILPLTFFIFWLLNKIKNDIIKTIIFFLGGILIFGLVGFHFIAGMGYLR